MSDGYIEHNFQTVVLKIQRRDRYILEEFAKDISYTGQIFDHEKITPKGTRYLGSGLILFSAKMSRDLAKYNIIPAKSKYKFPPINIPDKFIPNFIQGEFEGDGHVTKHSYYRDVRTVAIWDTLPVCIYIKEFIDKFYNRPIGRIFKRKNSDVYDKRAKELLGDKAKLNFPND